MSGKGNLSSKAISPRTVFFSIAAMALLMTGTVVVIIKMVGGSSSANDNGVARTATTNAPARIEHNTTSTSTLAHDYALIAKRNLFQPSTVASTISVPVSTELPKPTAPSTPVFTFTPSTPVSGEPSITPPHLAYTGMVELPSGHYALLENLDTKESIYARIGSTAFGYTVVDATSNTVSLEQNGDLVTLNFGANKAEDLGVTTPSANATPQTGQPTTTPNPDNTTGSGGAQPPTMNPNRNNYGGRGRFRSQSM